MSKIFASFPDNSTYDTERPDPNIASMWISTGNPYSESSFHHQFNDMAQFIVTPYHKIPDNTPYNIYIKCHNTSYAAYLEIIDGGLNKNYYYNMVIQDSKRGLVTWWFDQGWEKLLVTHHEQYHVLDWYGKLVLTLNCDNHPQNVNLLTGAEYDKDLFENINQTHGMRVHSVQPMEHLLNKSIAYENNFKNFTSLRIKTIESRTITHSPGLTYNRMPRPLRALLLAYLDEQNLIDKTNYSWGGVDLLPGLMPRNYRDWSTEQIIDHQLNTLVDQYGSIGEQYRDQAKSWYNKPTVNLSAENHDFDYARNPAENLNYIHAQWSNFQIVTETCYNHLTMLSEKSFKPFITLMPFIILGPAGSVQALRKRGYRTYDKWIDHSYDNHQLKFNERWQLFTTEVNRLYDLSPYEWADIKSQMLPDMIYNLYHFRSRSSNNHSNVFFS